MFLPFLSLSLSLSSRVRCRPAAADATSRVFGRVRGGEPVGRSTWAESDVNFEKSGRAESDCLSPSRVYRVTMELTYVDSVWICISA